MDRRLGRLDSRGSSSLRNEVAQLISVAGLALPALGIVVVDPLMSLVDTACIGRTSTMQLAALAPNSAVFNMVFQVFTFIGVSVTNVLACNSPDAPSISDFERKRRITAAQKLQSYALLASTCCGVTCTLICLLGGPWLLQLMGASETMLPLALPYLRIRCASAPAVMVMNACQGAFLGQQDTVTPLAIFLCAAVVNSMLSAGLVLGLRLGLVGAATATCTVQYLTAIAFVRSLRHKGNRGGIRLIWAGWPGWADLVPFMDVGWKLLTRTLFKMAAFASVSSAATGLASTAAASHQVALQLFWLLSFFPEPLSMTAQSLIARDSTDRHEVCQTAWLLLRLAGFLAVSLAGILAVAFLFGAYLFSTDPVVIGGVHDLVVPGMTSIVVCTYVVQCDGIFIGSLDFSHLPRTNLVACILCGFMLWYGQHQGYGLNWIWWAMVAFFSARLVQHVLHAAVHVETSAFGRYNRPNLVRDDSSAPLMNGGNDV